MRNDHMHIFNKSILMVRRVGTITSLISFMCEKAVYTVYATLLTIQKHVQMICQDNLDCFKKNTTDFVQPFVTIFLISQMFWKLEKVYVWNITLMYIISLCLYIKNPVIKRNSLHQRLNCISIFCFLLFYTFILASSNVLLNIIV